MSKGRMSVLIGMVLLLSAGMVFAGGSKNTGGGGVKPPSS
jgi:hypothetical protein